jgi:hypothetical protein
VPRFCKGCLKRPLFPWRLRSSGLVVFSQYREAQIANKSFEMKG